MRNRYSIPHTDATQIFKYLQVHLSTCEIRINFQDNQANEVVNFNFNGLFFKLKKVSQPENTTNNTIRTRFQF